MPHKEAMGVKYLLYRRICFFLRKHTQERQDNRFQAGLADPGYHFVLVIAASSVPADMFQLVKMCFRKSFAEKAKNEFSNVETCLCVVDRDVATKLSPLENRKRSIQLWFRPRGAFGFRIVRLGDTICRRFGFLLGRGVRRIGKFAKREELAKTLV
jgi:hypothetical protein